MDVDNACSKRDDAEGLFCSKVKVKAKMRDARLYGEYISIGGTSDVPISNDVNLPLLNSRRTISL